MTTLTKTTVASLADSLRIIGAAATLSDLTRTDVAALIVLADDILEDGSGRTLGDLGIALGLSKAAITTVADRLELSALATRERDARDRRITRMIITETGFNRLTAAIDAVDEVDG